MDRSRHMKELDTSVFTDEELARAQRKQLQLQDSRNAEWNSKHWNNRAARRHRRRTYAHTPGGSRVAA